MWEVILCLPLGSVGPLPGPSNPIQAQCDLKRNIAINGLEGLVIVHELALGSTGDEIPFTIGLDTVNRVATGSDKNVRMVRQERLDAVIGTARPVMIKMDVEEYEEEVLRGAQALLVETVTAEITKMLQKTCFERAYYDPFTRKLSHEPIGASASLNSVFIRDWEFVRSRLSTANHIDVLGYIIRLVTRHGFNRTIAVLTNEHDACPWSNRCAFVLNSMRLLWYLVRDEGMQRDKSGMPLPHSLRFIVSAHDLGMSEERNKAIELC
jgi:FkbM family methyltransferase